MVEGYSVIGIVVLVRRYGSRDKIYRLVIESKMVYNQVDKGV